MSDHKAWIAKVTDVQAIPKADNVQLAIVMGERTIVSKSVKIGDVGVLFPAELQLSEAYAHENNLHRHSDLNKDKEKTGFFDDNRRVRTQTFLKVKSEAYFAPLDSLSFTGANVGKMKVGDSFVELNGVEICRKYVNERTKQKIANGKQKATKKRAVPFFKEHTETNQFKHYADTLQKGDLISIQSKKHGTSHRSAFLKEVKDLSRTKRAVNWVTRKLTGYDLYPKEEYVVLTGSRRVILKGDAATEGFHGSNGFRFEVTEKLKPYLSQGMTIYGEIVGYANGTPIMGTHNPEGMKDKRFKRKYPNPMVYEYGCPEGTYRFHVYRITLTTEGGDAIDFTQPQLVKWCKDRDIEHSIDLIDPFVYDGTPEQLEWLKSKVEYLSERDGVVTEDFEDPSHISEGVIVRVDRNGLQPIFYKQKSWAFRVLEGIATESGELDTEDAS